MLDFQIYTNGSNSRFKQHTTISDKMKLAYTLSIDDMRNICQ